MKHRNYIKILLTMRVQSDEIFGNFQERYLQQLREENKNKNTGTMETISKNL